MRPDPSAKASDARNVNREKTVGIMPVRNASGQKPIALVQAEMLTYASKIAEVEFGSLFETDVYVWELRKEGMGDCSWLALSPRQQGQYPDEAVVVAGKLGPGGGWRFFDEEASADG